MNGAWQRAWNLLRGHLEQLWAVLQQVLVAQGNRQPAIPDKLPAGVRDCMAAGEGPRDVCGLAKVMRIVQRVLVHHLSPVHLLRRQPLP